MSRRTWKADRILIPDRTRTACIWGLRRLGAKSSQTLPVEGTGFELLVRGRGEAGCRAFDARLLGTRNDPATAIGAPRADTNRGFRVSRSIFDATRHVGAFVVPVAPRERPWFSFGGLQGRLVGSTAVRFFDANGSGRLTPSAARHHSICLGPTPDPKSTAKPTDGICKGSAKSWG